MKEKKGKISTKRSGYLIFYFPIKKTDLCVFDSLPKSHTDGGSSVALARGIGRRTQV